MTDDDPCERKCDCGDEVIVGPKLSDGQRIAIRHTSDHDVVPCFINPVRQGKPCMGLNVVALERIEGNRYGVTTILPERKGPSRVTTDAYRDGWDRVFERNDESN